MTKLLWLLFGFFWTRDEHGRHTVEKVPLGLKERDETQDKVLRESFRKGTIRKGKGDEDTK